MKYKNCILIMIVFILTSCGASSRKPVFVASSPPVQMILQEIAGTKADVEVLAGAGASPHTYEPKPSDMYKTQTATAVFHVSDFLDGWIARMPGNTRISLLDLIPRENLLRFSEMTKDTADTLIDPHFWTDPMTVKALLPRLADTLALIDPENAGVYRQNANTFAKRLDLLDRQLDKILSPVRGKPIFLFHPSFNYLIKRYGLVFAGAIEEAPGKEPTPKTLQKLSERVKKSGTRAIFTEPQLPPGPANVISENSGALIYELDPVGGTKKLNKYTDLIIHNARIIKKALD